MTTPSLDDDDTVLKAFLAVDRWQRLRVALGRQSATCAEPAIGSSVVVAALLLASTPVALTIVDQLTPETSSRLPTIAFGVCAVLGIVLRWRTGLPFFRTHHWRESLGLTHTAIALGCVPAVLVVLFVPELLAQRHDILTEAVSQAQPDVPQMSLFETLASIATIAMWAAVVEEVLFRAMLVSVIRRWRVLPLQRHRDIAAAVTSATIFGAAHYATWGPLASLALVGLGLGFVLAYIATGEQLLPVVIYHFIFDALSIGLSILL
ncbi:MAG: CPBP family intramembrane metalloprotease [Bdellovibrionales bacterium]|nr:CPBP family intramembrane metalloprotease [Bdellovibrionales bacterium]